MAAPTEATQPQAAQSPPAVHMFELISGDIVTQLVHVAAELRVADHLAVGPRPVDELAVATGAYEQSLFRVLRALAALGVFTEVAPRRFALTPLGDTLRDGAAGSMREMARMFGRDHYRAYADLIPAVRAGTPAFPLTFGTDWWSHIIQHPQEAEIFHAAMGNLAQGIHAAAVAAYDLSGVRHLVDVGGGHGYLATTILERYPNLTATVFDLPGVSPGAIGPLNAAGVSNRAEIVEGDFFDSVPEGGDVYLLSMILHDWDDGNATRILDNVASAMREGSRVVVVDAVIPEGDIPHFAKVLDIVMFAILGGQERTEVEWARLFEGSGLRLTEVLSTESPMSVIEAVAT